MRSRLPLGAGPALWHTSTLALLPLVQATAKATELFDKYAATHADGRLTLTELQQLMREASEEFPHLREHATFLDGSVLLVSCFLMPGPSSNDAGNALGCHKVVLHPARRDVP